MSTGWLEINGSVGGGMTTSSPVTTFRTWSCCSIPSQPAVRSPVAGCQALCSNES